MIISKFYLSSYFRYNNTNEGFVTSSLLKFNQSVAKCEQSKVFSDTDILTGMIFCTALANDDIACNGGLTTVDLYSQAFAM